MRATKPKTENQIQNPMEKVTPNERNPRNRQQSMTHRFCRGIETAKTKLLEAVDQKLNASKAGLNQNCHQGLTSPHCYWGLNHIPPIMIYPTALYGSSIQLQSESRQPLPQNWGVQPQNPIG